VIATVAFVNPINGQTAGRTCLSSKCTDFYVACLEDSVCAEALKKYIAGSFTEGTTVEDDGKFAALVQCNEETQCVNPYTGLSRQAAVKTTDNNLRLVGKDVILETEGKPPQSLLVKINAAEINAANQLDTIASSMTQQLDDMETTVDNATNSMDTKISDLSDKLGGDLDQLKKDITNDLTPKIDQAQQIIKDVIEPKLTTLGSGIDANKKAHAALVVKNSKLNAALGSGIDANKKAHAVLVVENSKLKSQDAALVKENSKLKSQLASLAKTVTAISKNLTEFAVFESCGSASDKPCDTCMNRKGIKGYLWIAKMNGNRPYEVYCAGGWALMANARTNECRKHFTKGAVLDKGKFEESSKTTGKFADTAIQAYRDRSPYEGTTAYRYNWDSAGCGKREMWCSSDCKFVGGPNNGNKYNYGCGQGSCATRANACWDCTPSGFEHKNYQSYISSAPNYGTMGQGHHHYNSGVFAWQRHPEQRGRNCGFTSDACLSGNGRLWVL